MKYFNEENLTKQPGTLDSENGKKFVDYNFDDLDKF